MNSNELSFAYKISSQRRFLFLSYFQSNQNFSKVYYGFSKLISGRLERNFNENLENQKICSIVHSHEKQVNLIFEFKIILCMLLYVVLVFFPFRHIIFCGLYVKKHQRRELAHNITLKQCSTKKIKHKISDDTYDDTWYMNDQLQTPGFARDKKLLLVRNK